MKICITSLGNNLDSEVDPRFGRCRYFIVVDSDTSEFEVIENLNIAGRGGVGIQSAQLVSNKGVEVVLTGNTGPNAYRTLEAAGIKAITGVSGKIKEVIEKFKKGEYESASSSSVSAKFGMQTSQPQKKPAEEESNQIDDLEKQAKSLREKLNEINKKMDDLKKE